ncbi:phosphotransferase family protein [Sinosporangium siamense]|uniref:Aminoglycoside phosphotransferase domain-containing protein n=1 Tax=Sinosporangium siamense TaxID=1367973 RepID=A0A919VB60_9ACTN|nr:aminoglycoside phosphotransferase family protein [Sinosporangium siamense]GII91789.1 hypothetical protein Ssi02_20200 [Sinosporangium siamense]
MRRSLLERLLPGDAWGDLEVRRGQFHEVFLGAERVVCFARTAAASARLPGRAETLRSLARLDLGFKVPVPLEEGDGYLVLSRVPGSPLAREAVADPAVAVQYSSLLEALANAGAAAALPRAAEDQWRRFASDVRAELFPLMSQAGRRRADGELAAAEALPWTTGALVHGDLGAENVLWETAGGSPRLSGVIDWDEASLGDPAEDFAAIGASYGDGFLHRVLASSGRLEGDLLGRITAIRGTFALQQALYASRDGDEEEMADGLAGYQ